MSPYSKNEDRKKHNQKYYTQNKEKIKERERKRYADNRSKIRGRRKELVTRELREKNAERERIRYAKQRQVVIDAYGNICSCCGESELLFLEIDHIENNGKEHRKQIGTGAKTLVCWLIQNKFPDGFQILCSNCNQGKKRNGGTCPHKSKKDPSCLMER